MCVEMVNINIPERLSKHRARQPMRSLCICVEREFYCCYHSMKINIGESLQFIFLFTLINIKSNEKRKILSLSFSRDLRGQAI